MPFLPNERIQILPGEPSDFEVRRAALQVAIAWRAEQSMQDLFRDAQRFERYLRGEPEDTT